MEAPVIFLVVILLLSAFWVVANYNRFVRVRQHLRESWAGIDVELKRRHDLIPNLVQTVKGFARHEADLLERVTRLRAKAAASHDNAASLARDEVELLRGLKQVFAVAEAYPTLRSDRHFQALQKELALTEDRIAAARRLYNGNVRDLRQLREMFPTSLLAQWFGFQSADFFELDSDVERVVPRLDL